MPEKVYVNQLREVPQVAPTASVTLETNMDEQAQREKRGQQAIDAARKSRFEMTGEPSQAPRFDEAVEARKDRNATPKK